MSNISIDFSKLPSRQKTDAFVEGMIGYLFPTEQPADLAQHRAAEKERLQGALMQLLKPIEDKLSLSPDEVAGQFFYQADEVFNHLLADAQFFQQSDPAAECIEEVVVAYPGFYAIAVYRLAHILYELKVPILPRLITENAHTHTGIDIHPGATIGVPFFIDHGTGIVIGQTTIIGNKVRLYQGVTLGALAVRKEAQGQKRHPTIEDNVIIYAGSCILGGDTVVGHDSVIGGNVWLTESVLPFSIVYTQTDVRIRDKSEMKEVIDYVI